MPSCNFFLKINLANIVFIVISGLFFQLKTLKQLQFLVIAQQSIVFLLIRAVL